MTQNTLQISGDAGEGDPPVLIPNTAVKPFSADSTWRETAREGRSLPDSTKQPLGVIPAALLIANGKRE